MGSRLSHALFFFVFIIFIIFFLVDMQNVAAARPMPAFGIKAEDTTMALWMMRLPSGPSDRGAGH
ncbi:hypothetical protein MA16_Dca016310 [Dendrobium catenatum]|uniref:Transmembrane protein n=1 Tax=Dendrobium catenatum TaxID=906689 RepID=A0A2I0W866_9ASPA|nr:hypothetical protein MA16_Dca016310 [Dendrobium catenatum]